MMTDSIGLKSRQIMRTIAVMGRDEMDKDVVSRKAAQKYVSVMEKIELVHALKNALPCFEFDFSINPYLGFWYAEEGLYLIRDCMVDAYYFVEARSPHKAIEKVLKRVDEALHAGEPQNEEYE